MKHYQRTIGLIAALGFAAPLRVDATDTPAPSADLMVLLAGELDYSMERLIAEEAERTVRSSGIALNGFARALGAVVPPYLEIARRMDWPEEVLFTLGAEIEGHLDVELDGLRPRQIAFRADRVDSRGDGLLLTDYKTGASPFTQKKADVRHKNYVNEVRRGRRLQPVVYALAAGEPENFGRFTFLRPRFDGPEEARDGGTGCRETAS